jgi:ADP-heptose:LPS heptosyltransferase
VALGITTSDLRTVVVPTPEEEAAATELRAATAAAGAAWLLHPGAGKQQNLWPAQRFAAVARRAAASGAPVLVLQGPADGPALVAFAAALTTAPAAERERITVLPRQSVGVCAALLAGADRFLCNDTGLMHVAGAVGTPTLALFGPTDPALWKPPAAAVQALRAEGGRLDSLDEAVVWEAWRRLPSRQAGTV